MLFPLVLSFFFSRFVSPWGYSKAVEEVPELGNGQEKTVDRGVWKPGRRVQYVGCKKTDGFWGPVYRLNRKNWLTSLD